MIQLFVNNKEVLLPYDFSITIIEENPEITSNGEYTLDITLSLLEPQNAIAFGHLNRLNKIVIKKDAEGILIIDNKSRFGKIVVLKNSDIEVTFQFIAGNSELNYNAKEDNRKIWELNWETETAIDYARALDSITSPSYTKKFVCAPIKVSDKIMNDYTMRKAMYLYMTPFIQGVNNIIMQPYLLYYINKLPSLLGFTLNTNILNTDERAMKMFLINSIESLNYSDALPNLTVTEFISAIESYFNVLFLIDNTSKELSIIRVKDIYDLKNKVIIEKCLDSYERDLSQTPKSLTTSYSSLSYNFKDSRFFKYQKISEEILSKAEIMNFNSYTDIKYYIEHTATDLSDQVIIYRDTTLNKDYFLMQYATKNTSQGIYRKQVANPLNSNVWELVLINKFRSSTEDKSNEFFFKITPAEITRVGQITRFRLGRDSFYQDYFYWNGTAYYQCPVSSNGYYKNKTIGMIESIETGIPTVNRIDFLEVALYFGLRMPYHEEGEVYTNESYSGLHLGTIFGGTFPFSGIDDTIEFGYGDRYFSEATFISWLQNGGHNVATPTLRIIGDNNVILEHQESVIDNSKEYNFTLEDEPNVNTKNIFVINNKEYIPISLQREKSNKPSAVLAKCYAML